MSPETCHRELAGWESGTESSPEQKTHSAPQHNSVPDATSKPRGKHCMPRAPRTAAAEGAVQLWRALGTTCTLQDTRRTQVATHPPWEVACHKHEGFGFFWPESGSPTESVKLSGSEFWLLMPEWAASLFPQPPCLPRTVPRVESECCHQDTRLLWAQLISVLWWEGWAKGTDL